MIFEFGNQFNIHDVSIEIEADGNVSYHNMQAPAAMIVQQFLVLANQVIHDNRSLRFKFVNYIPVYRYNTGETVNMPCTIEFKNTAYLNQE